MTRIVKRMNGWTDWYVEGGSDSDRDRDRHRDSDRQIDTERGIGWR